MIVRKHLSPTHYLTDKSLNQEIKMKTIVCVMCLYLLTSSLSSSAWGATPYSEIFPSLKLLLADKDYDYGVLVKDIWPGENSSSISYLTDVNGTLFFRADDGIHGYELWKSDGTETGTALVKDINSGVNSSEVARFTVFNGTLFFLANDNIHGSELWKSDGTADGTILVKDIYPGSYSSWESSNEIAVVNDTLFFTSYDGNHGRELWKSDGTEAGTVLVKDIYAGTVSSTPENFFDCNGTLFFTADNDSHGRELWKSDGTEAGTVLVKDIYPGIDSSSPAMFFDFNGTLFFTANDGIYGYELWKSDGTEAGTVLVKDIYAGYNYWAPSLRNFIDVGGTLFFLFSDDLWKSDGTTAGTVKVKSIGGFYNPLDFNGMLIFSTYDNKMNQELWKSDGTEVGTTLVKEFTTDDDYNDHHSLKGFIIIDDTLYFMSKHLDYGWNLWKSDGTTKGTTLLEDFPCSFFDYTYNIPICFNSGSGLFNFNDTLFFSSWTSSYGWELWQADGTATGTDKVKGIHSTSVQVGNFCDSNGILYFIGNHRNIKGEELWKLDRK